MLTSQNKTLDLFGSLPAAQAGIAVTDKIAKMIATRKGNTAIRNEKITQRFNDKFNIERKRYDDVINELCAEFSLAKSTIEKVITG